MNCTLICLGDQPKCATCRYFNRDGYCQLLDKKVKSTGCCCDYEED